MSIADEEKRGASAEFMDSDLWRELKPEPYECRVYLLPENNGFSAYVTNLPGVASQGETEASALDNLNEAFRGASAVYQSEPGGQVPWLSESEEKPPGALERWIWQMPSLPAVNGRQAIRAFEKVGFVVARIEGSHHIMKKPEHEYVLTVPVHGNRAVKPGTLRSLIRAAGITVDAFVALLD